MGDELTVFELVPLYSLEEGVLHELVDAVLAESLVRRRDQVANQVFRVIRHVIAVVWEAQVVLNNTITNHTLKCTLNFTISLTEPGNLLELM